MYFSDLRKTYPKFYYHGYTVGQEEQSLHITYHFAVTGLCEFHPTWDIPCTDVQMDDALTRLIFSLGMAELVSYWKLTCSPQVVVECAALSPAQIAWWKKLYFNGLGEFFYRNQIETDMDEFMSITANGEPLPDTSACKELSGKLIPVGGGKDSIVTMNLLADEMNDAAAFMINHRDSSVAGAKLAGITDDRIYEVRRTLDSNLLQLNKLEVYGAPVFLNGHTPFSAIVAFSSVLTAYLKGHAMVVLSNESSASEATVSFNEMEVNHQYSKSYAFEQDFFAYERDYLKTGIRYFSLLRPLTEFQIARYFASCDPAFHEAFRSCNVGSKQDIWCGNCAKCLFVSVILSPFMPRETLCKIMGRDMLDDEGLQPILEELCGAVPNKPFECVGSRKEVNIALCLAIARMEEAGEPLPKLLDAYREMPLYKEYRGQAAAYGNEWDTQHNLPPALETLVRKAILK